MTLFIAIGIIELDEEKEVDLLLHGAVKEFMGYDELL